jgi:hypothetical protein
VDDATKEDVLWADGLAVGSPTHMGDDLLEAQEGSLTRSWENFGGKLTEK